MVVRRHSISTRPLLVIGMTSVACLGFGVMVVGDDRDSGAPSNKPAQSAPAESDETKTPSSSAPRPLKNDSNRPNESGARADSMIRQLDNQQLASLVRGELIDKTILESYGISPSEFKDLLLRELARRLVDESRGEAPAATDATEQPAIAESMTANANKALARRDSAVIAGTNPFAESVDRNPADTSPPDADDVSTPESEDVPDGTIKVEQTIAEVLVAEPMSVGRIELKFVDGHGPTVYPDQPVVIQASDDRAHYAVFDIDYMTGREGTTRTVKRIEALFLVRDRKPIELSLHGNGQEWFRQKLDTFIDHPSGRSLKSRWWASFSKIEADERDEARELKQTLLTALAKRHRVPAPISFRRSQDTDNLSSLEGQFERAVGMLFGFESVKLALQDDVILSSYGGEQFRLYPLPPPPTLRSVPVPNFRPGWIEPIAKHVPQECFYLRTGSIANYREFRGFLNGWGGNLNDVVGSGAFDRNTRAKIERQLAFDYELAATRQVDRWISDVALIGLDPLFHDGAAVGIILEAKGDGTELLRQLKSQRGKCLQTVGDAKEQRLEIDRRSVSLIATDDNRVRSFYAIDGKYHLITNSRTLVERFFESGRGKHTLGQLREFAYAKSKVDESTDALGFLYLSDPFFRNLVGPRFRIEMTRRERARRELQSLKMATLLAEAEGITDRSPQQLIQAGFLPQTFGKRVDHSKSVFENGRYRDSLRGQPGVFLPIADVGVREVTSDEAAAYRKFVLLYNREWRRIDPVTVVFSRQGVVATDATKRFGVEIIVTPYAPQRYALLNRHLANATAQRLSTSVNDLISVQAAVRMKPGTRSHLLAIGLRDDEVPFEIRDGKIRLLGEDAGTTFASSRAYGAISPPDTDILRMLGSVLLTGKEPPANPPQRRTQPRSLSSLLPPIGVPGTSAASQPMLLFAWAFSSMSPEILSAAKYSSLVESRRNLTLVSMSSQLRDLVFDEMAQERVDDPHQIRLTMRALQDSKVEPYIQAYTFLEARHRSADNTRLLNDFTDWLKLPPDQSREVVEDLVGARLTCPLGGDFQVKQRGDQSTWTSTAWTNDSAYEVTNVSPDWKFPFLDWLRGMDVRFDLVGNTLRAQVALQVHSAFDDRDPAAGENRVVVRREAISVPSSVVPSSGVSSSGVSSSGVTASGGNERSSTDDWILGIRVAKHDRRLRILSVHANSPASRAGLRTGDVILNVDGDVPANSKELLRRIETAQRIGVVHLQFDRGGSKRYLRISLPNRSPFP